MAAIGAPERLRDLVLDLGAADADIAQQPVIQFGQLAALTRAFEPVDDLVEEARDKAAAGLADTRNGLSTSIEVVTFDSLLMHFAEQMKAGVIIRGLRAVSDFEYEFQMTGMNARLNPDIETVFLMASERSQFISSRFVKEIHKLGGDVSQFVSPRVIEALKRK